MPWRPLSVREDTAKLNDYDALREGVPLWLRPGVAAWVVDVIGAMSGGHDYSDALLRIEQLLRLPMNWSNGSRTALVTLVAEIDKDRPRALDVVDCLLMLSADVSGSWKMGRDLDATLVAGGSAWTVAKSPDGAPCLQRRVDRTVAEVASAVMAHRGNAAHHLRVAWHKAYGRDVDPSGAYREAVRAVEAAAKPVVAPNDSVATLGKMLTAMRDKPTKWTAELGSVDVVSNMMGQLWKSQLDRHGTDDENMAIAVTPQQAEAGLHLAVTLVHWFQSGAIRPA